MGGFASTASWPLSALLVEQVGWRGTCLAYAALQITVSLPLILWLIPASRAEVPVDHTPKLGRPVLTPRERRAFLAMAAILVLGGTVMTMLSVHLLTLLQARAVPLASAVAFGALIGPSQVAARVMEMTGKGRHHPLWTLTAAMALVAIASGC